MILLAAALSRNRVRKFRIEAGNGHLSAKHG